MAQVRITATGNWTAPAGVTSVDVELWGAGGGGANSWEQTQFGGSAGAYVKVAGVTVVPGNSYSFVIGAGGGALTGGTGYMTGGNGSANSGHNGGGGGGSTSGTFGATTYIAAGGAGGGYLAPTAASGTSGGVGGKGDSGTNLPGAGGGGAAGTNGGNAAGNTGGAAGTGATACTGTNGTAGNAGGGTSAGASGNGNSSSDWNGANGSGGAAGAVGGAGAAGANGTGSDSGGAGGGATGSGMGPVPGGNGGTPGAGGGGGCGGGNGTGGSGLAVLTYTPPATTSTSSSTTTTTTTTSSSTSTTHTGTTTSTSTTTTLTTSTSSTTSSTTSTSSSTSTTTSSSTSTSTTITHYIPVIADLYRVSTVSGVTSIQYLSPANYWTSMTGDGTGLSNANQFSHAYAEQCLFLTNKIDDPRYIDTDGSTIVTPVSKSSVGALCYLGSVCGCPKARKINYFRDRLYVADFEVGGQDYPNRVQMSSPPLGIVALVDGDQNTGSTTVNVTDTRYVMIGTGGGRTYHQDALEVWRGNAYVTTLIVSGKSDTQLTLYLPSGADLLSADELWAYGSHGGPSYFHWAMGQTSGINVKQYDTFTLSGGQNDRIKMLTNLGSYMVIANDNNLGLWDNVSLTSLEMGIGCVSDEGYVRAQGSLWFVHSTGIYSLDVGTAAPKLMSTPVKPYLDGATRSGLENCCAGRQGLSVFFAIGDVTMYRPDGSVDKVLKDTCLEYDIRQQNWYVHSGISAKMMRNYKTTDELDALAFASKQGIQPIMKFLDGEIDDRNSASPNEIIFRVDTPPLTLAQMWEDFVYPKELTVECGRGGNITCFVALDDEPFYEIPGTISKGITVLRMIAKNNISTPPRCRRIRFSFRDSTKQICKIYRVSLNYESVSDEKKPL